ncbi:hypothetical protein Ddc_14344 [Ditylenchus destructor]|nr:hypothetical protein Ddc_14344 [Ditylenchus destructor]
MFVVKEGHKSHNVGDKIKNKNDDIWTKEGVCLSDFDPGGDFHEEIAFIRQQLVETLGVGRLPALFDDHFSLFRWAAHCKGKSLATLVDAFQSAVSTLKRLEMIDVKFTTLDEMEKDFVRFFGNEPPLLSLNLMGCDENNNLFVRTVIGNGNANIEEGHGIDTVLFQVAYLYQIVKVIESKTKKRQMLRVIVDFSEFNIRDMHKYRELTHNLQETFPELASDYIAITGRAVRYLFTLFRYLSKMETISEKISQMALASGDAVAYLLFFFKHYVHNKEKLIHITADEEPNYTEGVTMERLLEVLRERKTEL